MTILNIKVKDNFITRMWTIIFSFNVNVDNKRIGRLKDNKTKFELDRQKLDLTISDEFFTSNRIKIESLVTTEIVDIEVESNMINWEFTLVGLLVLIISFISTELFEEQGFLIMNLIPSSLALIYFLVRGRNRMIRISIK
jgi:hypothetical protein